MIKNNRSIEKIGITAVVLSIVIFILLFLIGPVFQLLQQGVFNNLSDLPNTISDIIQSKSIMQSLWDTLIMAVLTVITVNILGVFQLLVTKIFNFGKYSKIFENVFSVALVCNGIIIVVGYLFLFGSNGVANIFFNSIGASFDMNWFRGLIPILIIHTFSFSIFHQFFVGDAINRVDGSLIENARTLGASTRQILTKIIFPIILPTLITSSVFVFLFSIGSNAAPSFLGGKLFPMMNPTINNLNGIGDRDTAMLLSIILGLIALIMYVIFISQQKKLKLYSQNIATKPFKKIDVVHNGTKFIFYVLSVILCLIYILPLITSVLFSFTSIDTIYLKRFDSGLTIDNYVRFFNNPGVLRPIQNSILLGGIASIIALIIGISIVLLNANYKNIFTKFLENIFTLIWMVPSIMLAIGVSAMFSNKMPFGIVIDKSFLLPLTYTTTIIYIVIYIIKVALRNINHDMIDAARSLSCGASQMIKKIYLPILLPSIVSTFVICFNITLTEYTISEILYTHANSPISVFFRSELSNPSAYQMANILIYTTIIVFISFMTIFLQSTIKKRTLRYNGIWHD
jgi:iron(III) transport system permease protein